MRRSMKRIKTFKHFQKRGIDVPTDPSEIQLDEMNGKFEH